MLSQGAAVWILIVLATAAANIPFFNERLMALVSVKRFITKPPFVVIAELFVWYFVIGFVAYGFETALVNPFPRGWEFYVITLCIFMVLGFPGFVYRYLLKR